MAVQPASSILNTLNAVAGSPTQNPARRIAQIGDSMLSNKVRGAEAVVQGIQAASIHANRQNRDLFFTLLRSRLNNDPTITNALRNSARDPDAVRFDANASYKQLRRIYLTDAQNGLKVAKVNYSKPKSVERVEKLVGPQ